MTTFNKPYRVAILLPLLYLLTATAPVQADSGEYQVKAAMVFNMLRFMDWPDEALPATDSPFTICVSGKGPLGTALEKLRGKQIKGKAILVRQLGQSTHYNGCKALVAGSESEGLTSGLLDQTRSLAIVTIGEGSTFTQTGGVVGFVLQDGKVRFKINMSAARRHQIRISAQLLKLALTVQEEP